MATMTKKKPAAKPAKSAKRVYFFGAGKADGNGRHEAAAGRQRREPG